MSNTAPWRFNFSTSRLHPHLHSPNETWFLKPLGTVLKSFDELTTLQEVNLSTGITRWFCPCPFQKASCLTCNGKFLAILEVFATNQRSDEFLWIKSNNHDIIFGWKGGKRKVLPNWNDHAIYWRLIYNLKMMLWKMTFLFKQVIFRFHVNFQGCNHW